MYIAIITIGSRGDVQPYIALALGLMARGHRVRLFAQENFSPFVKTYGVEYFPLPGNMEELMNSSEVKSALRAGNLVTLLKAFLRGLKKKNQPTLHRDVQSGLEAADAIITNMLGLPMATAIGEKAGKPCAIVHLGCPMNPTRAFPFAPMAIMNFPAYNKFTYWLLWALAWKSSRLEINGLRNKLGLLPLQQTGYLRMVLGGLNLYAVSPAFISRPADWGPLVDITGFLVLPEKRRAESDPGGIPDGLEAWLQAGGKPVYIGFGSIPIPRPEILATIMEEWLERRGVRIVFCEGWSAPLPMKKHPNLFIVKAINHDWLLPKCEAAIIHGGIGTLAAVLRAGIPVVIVSIFGDQPVWGKYVQQQGLGASLPFTRMNVRRLTEAMDRALMPACRSRVAEIREKIRQEDGVRQAAARIEEYFISEMSKVNRT